LHLAMFRRVVAGDDAEQGCLPGAVAANQTDPGAGWDLGRRLVKDKTAADPHGQFVEVQHREVLAEPCGIRKSMHLAPVGTRLLGFSSDARLADCDSQPKQRSVRGVAPMTIKVRAFCQATLFVCTQNLYGQLMDA
jgi:hypothetical protein